MSSAVVAGISDYGTGPGRPPSLLFGKWTAETFRQHLASSEVGPPAGNLRLLRNEEVTGTAIRSDLARALRYAGDRGTVLFFFSGYVVEHPTQGILLVPYDGRQEERPRRNAGLPLTKLRDLASSGEKGPRLVVLVEGTLLESPGPKNTEAEGPDASKTKTGADAGGAPAKVSSSFAYLVGMRRSCAANGEDPASDDHGLFTSHLIRGLVGEADRAQEGEDRDGKITLGEIQEYLLRQWRPHGHSREVRAGLAGAGASVVLGMSSDPGMVRGSDDGHEATWPIEDEADYVFGSDEDRQQREKEPEEAGWPVVSGAGDRVEAHQGAAMAQSTPTGTVGPRIAAVRSPWPAPRKQGFRPVRPATVRKPPVPSTGVTLESRAPTGPEPTRTARTGLWPESWSRKGEGDDGKDASEETGQSKKVPAVSKRAGEGTDGHEKRLTLSARDLVKAAGGWRDPYGNPTRRGQDSLTGLPLEVRERKTGMPLVLAPSVIVEGEGLPGEFVLYIGKYEVTNREFEYFDPRHKNVRGVKYRGKLVSAHDDTPVVEVSHDRALGFCYWLSGGGKSAFRLPYLTEWTQAHDRGGSMKVKKDLAPERAVRLGNFADGSARLVFNLSWGSRFSDGYPTASRAGKYSPDGLGLYDLNGNVWEWVQTSKATMLAFGEPPRVCLGGSWLSPPGQMRQANRGAPSKTIGFRVALPVRIDEWE